MCRVLDIARQPYYRWLADPVTDTELEEAYRANALFDAHREDPAFGYRFLADEAREAGESTSDRTAWRICSTNRWRSAFGKKHGSKKGRSGPPVHDDLVGRIFTVDDPNRLWLTDIPPSAPRREVPHRTPHRGGQVVSVCGQGRLLEPDRRLFDQRSDEVPARRGRPRIRGGPARLGRRMRGSFRSWLAISSTPGARRPLTNPPHRRTSVAAQRSR